MKENLCLPEVQFTGIYSKRESWQMFSKAWGGCFQKPLRGHFQGFCWKPRTSRGPWKVELPLTTVLYFPLKCSSVELDACPETERSIPPCLLGACFTLWLHFKSLLCEKAVGWGKTPILELTNLEDYTWLILLFRLAFQLYKCHLPAIGFMGAFDHSYFYRNRETSYGHWNALCISWVPWVSSPSHQPGQADTTVWTQSTTWNWGSNSHQ